MARIIYRGRCAVVDRGFVGLAAPETRATPTTTPPASPTWLRIFAF
jgi:hypothetical protein